MDDFWSEEKDALLLQQIVDARCHRGPFAGQNRWNNYCWNMMLILANPEFQLLTTKNLKIGKLSDPIRYSIFFPSATRRGSRPISVSGLSRWPLACTAQGDSGKTQNSESGRGSECEQQLREDTCQHHQYQH